MHVLFYKTTNTYSCVVLQITYIRRYVTRQENHAYVRTQNTTLCYFNYFTFCVSYKSSVNSIGFQTVACTISKNFIATVCFDKSY